MSVSVGELLLELKLDPEAFNRDMDRMRSQVMQTAQQIERDFRKNAKITLETDERPLFSLNKHLDKKTPHLKQVVRDFKANPIKAYTDDSELTGLNKNLDNLEKRQDQLSKGKTPASTSNTESAVESGIQEALSNIEQGLDNFGKRLTKALVSPFESISTGFFEEIGRSFSKDIGKGLTGSLEKELGFNLNEIGQKSGNFLSKGIKSVKQGNQTTGFQPDLSNLSSLKRESEPIGIPLPNTNIKAKVNLSKKSISLALESNLNDLVFKSLENIKLQVASKNPDIEQTKAHFAKIRTGFSSAYKKLQEYMESGNLELAKAHADMLLSMSKTAKTEIDSIKNNLKNAGLPAHFGSELTTLAGSTKGVIQSKYVKPTERNLVQIQNQKQSNDYKQVGNDVVAGVSEGLKGKALVTRQASLLALHILTTMKDELGIKSPSRKAMEIAEQIGQGLIAGMRLANRAVIGASASLGQSVLGGLKTGSANQQATKQIAKQQRQILQQEFGSVEYFDAMWDAFGNQFQKKALKGLSPNQSKGLSREVAGAGFSAAAMLAPFQTMMGALSPLLMPSAPLLATGAMVNNLISPVINRIREALQTVEPLKNRLNVLSGSPQAGKQELDYIQSVSSKYNVSLGPAGENYSKLAVASKGTKLEGEGVKNLFEGISASIKAMELNTFDAQLVFNSYTQILAKGKLSMEELRQQLGEKFPPAMNVFAKALGISVPELNALIGKGAILSEDILPKVADVLLKDFGNAASQASGTFTSAMVRIENAGTDLNIKLVESFGGIFAGVTNLGATALEAFNKNFSNIAKVAGVFLIGITAQIAVALQTIVSIPAIAGKLGAVQNLFASTLKKSVSTLTPFFAGVFVDMIDDVLGAKKSVMENMTDGVTNMFTALFSNLDNASRETFNKPLFGSSFGEQEVGIIQSITTTISGLFKAIPPGVGEMIALIVMFEQVAVLGKMLLVPTFKNIGSGLKDIGSAFYNAATKASNIKDAFSTILSSTSQMGPALAKIGYFAMEAALAIAVLAFSKSDFSNPLSQGFDKARRNIIDDIKDIKKELEGLKTAATSVGSGVAESFKLPSKGLELNPAVWFGMSEDSYKSDDFYRDIDANKIPFFGSGISDTELKKAQETKRKADDLGIGQFFTGQEKNITLSQKQLLNNASDLADQRKGIEKQLSGLNLSPDTVSNFMGGDIQNTLSSIRNIDSQLENLGQKRVKLALVDTSGTKKEIRDVDKEINNLLKQRKDKQKPLQSILGNIDDIKKQIDNQISAIEQSDLPNSAKKSLKAILEPQKKMIDETVDYLKKQGLHKLAEPLAEVWQTVIDKLRDADKAFEKFTNNSKIQSAQNQSRILLSNETEGEKSYQMDTLNLQNLGRNESAQRNILQFRQKSLERLLSISGVETSESRKEEVAKLRETVEKDKLQLAESQVAIAQARTNLDNKLREQTKQVADYYRAIARQAEEQAIEVQKLQNQVNTSTQTNKLKKAILGFQDNIVTQFVDGIISSLEQMNTASDSALDAQSQLIQSTNQYQDTQRQGLELSRSLPGQLPKIPVLLDLSSIQDDTNIQDLNSAIKDAADSTSGLKDQVQYLEDCWNQNVDSASKLSGGVDEVAKSSANVYDQLFKTNDVLADGSNKLVDSSTKTTEWAKSALAVTTELNSASGFMDKIFQGIQNAIAATGKWLNDLIHKLGKVGELMPNLTQNADGSPNLMGKAMNKAGDWAGQAGDAVKNGWEQTKAFFGFGPQVNQGNYKVNDSSTGAILKDFSQVSVHHPNSRKMHGGKEPGRDYEMVDGKLEEVKRSSRGVLVTKDMVLSKNGRTDVPIPAPVSGIVGPKFGHGVGKVQILDLAGNLLTEVLHLVNLKVKPGDKVQYGQTLGTQGGAGGFPVHLHASMRKEEWKNYLRDMNDGGFDTNTSNCTLCGGTNHNSGQHIQTANKEYTQRVASSKVTDNPLSSGNTLKTPPKTAFQSYQVRELESGKIVQSYNANKNPNSSASTLKLLVADILVDAVKGGQISLNKKLNIQKQDIAEGSKLNGTMTVGQALQKMLKESDNTATNTLITALGGTESLNQSIKKKYPNSNLGNKFSIPGAKGFTNNTTANDISAAMVSLFEDNSDAAKIAQRSLQQTRNFGYKGEVGGKIGNNSRVVGNAGLAEINGKKYVISGFINEGDSPQTRKKLTSSTNSLINHVRDSKAIAKSSTRGGSLQSGSFSGGGKYSKTLNKLSPEFLKKNSEVAARLGTSPENLLAVMGFETGGTFSPSVTNPLGYTGLIQFSPQYSPKILGKTTAQLRKQGQVEQLGDVEKYINANRRGKNVSSLEDLYMSVLMPSHVGKGKNSVLPGWIYKANKGLDVDRDGKITVNEATQKVRDYLPASFRKSGQSVMRAANRGQAATPQQNQGAIAGAMVTNQQTYQQKQELTQQRGQQEQEKNITQARKTAIDAIWANKRARRDLDDQSLASERSMTDMAYAAKYNPTPAEAYLMNQTRRRREVEDEYKKTERDKEDTLQRIGVTKSVLESGALNSDQVQKLESKIKGLGVGQISTDIRDILSGGMEKDLANLDKLNAKLERLEQTKKEVAETERKTYERQEMIKKRDSDFKVTENLLSEANAQIEKLKQLQEVNPSSSEAKKLPELEAEVQLLQVSLDYRKKIADANDRLFDHKIDSGVYDEEIKSAKIELETKERTIEATKRQKQIEQDIAALRRGWEFKQQSTNLDIDAIRSRSSLRELGIGSGNQLAMNRDADLMQNSLQYSQKQLELQEMGAKGGVAGKLKAGKLSSLESRNNLLRIQSINAQYGRSVVDENLAAQDKYFQSSQDLRSGKSAYLRTHGMEYAAKQYDKESAIEQQNYSFQGQIRDLDRLVASGKIAGETAGLIKQNYEQLNQVKLDDIQAQFDPLTEVTTNAMSAFQGFFSSVITGSSSIGDAFKTMISNIGTQLANLATQMLMSEVFGGLFGGGKKQSSGFSLSDGGGLFGGDGGGLLDGLFGGGGGLLGGLFGGIFSKGGPIPNFADGGAIADAAMKERSQSGRTPRLVMAHVGEMLIPYERTQALARAGWGEKALLHDPIPNYAAGGVVGAAVPAMNNTVNNAPGITINVTVNGGDATSSGDKGNGLGNALKNAIIATIIDQGRPGGVLYNNK